MVTTKISEIARNRLGWVDGNPPSSSGGKDDHEGLTSPANVPSTSRGGHDADTLSISTYLGQANEVLYSAAENTYSSMSNALSSMYPIGGYGDDPVGGGSLHSDDTSQTGSTRAKRRGTIFTSYPGLLSIFKNPHTNTRHVNERPFHSPTSLFAVRSLLSVVPPLLPSSDHEISNPIGDDYEDDSDHRSFENPMAISTASLPAPELSPSSSETASQLAEGTLRAVRDIALEEAVMLHASLRYWSYRWERPFLSWVEAGPLVWFSEEGYQHHEIGQKVSTIQAVLARRCAAIGILQQHLLRAGWQRGVAQWGVLGDGGEWAAVAGIDGTLSKQKDVPPIQDPSDFPRIPSELSNATYTEHEDAVPHEESFAHVGEPLGSQPSNRNYYANVFVKKNHDGKVFIDDPALAEWAVHAVEIVRRQLNRAANGLVELPYAENWVTDQEESHVGGESGALIIGPEEVPARSKFGHSAPKRIPLWASLTPVEENTDYVDAQDLESQKQARRVTITDLPLMAEEISELLDVMEGVMQIQCNRRLQKLQPPSWIRRNWLLVSAIVPSVCLVVTKALSNEYGWKFFKAVGYQVLAFFREHITEPFAKIFTEVFKGTINISDREARDIAIDTLKEMIRSWLDENYPDMPIPEKERMSEMMDMSLIETRKATSMKSMYELNNVIRMSFIEAQFLKKEMMNALVALDEMQASNNINMNLAAVTPALLLLYGVKRMFQYTSYYLLKLGKSREETYGSFLHVLTDIERLLVMRDNPPKPPLLSSEESQSSRAPPHEDEDRFDGNTVLHADDLGMLMLHLHELRTILWQRRGRFSPDTIRSVSEDLVELAGERGAVSVRQQLSIISRMNRYPFLRQGVIRRANY